MALNSSTIVDVEWKKVALDGDSLQQNTPLPLRKRASTHASNISQLESSWEEVQHPNNATPTEGKSRKNSTGSRRDKERPKRKLKLRFASFFGRHDAAPSASSSETKEPTQTVSDGRIDEGIKDKPENVNIHSEKLLSDGKDKLENLYERKVDLVWKCVPLSQTIDRLIDWITTNQTIITLFEWSLTHSIDWLIDWLKDQFIESKFSSDRIRREGPNGADIA